MTDWRTRAACADDPRFPEEPASEAERDELAGVCLFRCPVAAQCLGAALGEEGRRGHSDRFGIRGGLWAKERARLARTKDRAEFNQLLTELRAAVPATTAAQPPRAIPLVRVTRRSRRAA